MDITGTGSTRKKRKNLSRKKRRQLRRQKLTQQLLPKREALSLLEKQRKAIINKIKLLECELRKLVADTVVNNEERQSQIIVIKKKLKNFTLAQDVLKLKPLGIKIDQI